MRQAMRRTARLVRALRRRPGVVSPPGDLVTGPAPARSIEDCARYGGGLVATCLAPDQVRTRYHAHDMPT